MGDNFSALHSPGLFFGTNLEHASWLIAQIAMLFLLAIFLLSNVNRFVIRPLNTIRHFRKQGVQGPPFKLVFGQLAAFRQSIKLVEKTGKNLQFLMDWKKQYGDVFYYCIGPKVRLAVLDPSLAHQVLQTTSGNGGVYRKVDYAAEVFEPVLGKYGLVFVSNDRWSRQRKLVNPMFSHGKLKDMEPYMVDCARDMVRRWEAAVAAAGGRAEIEVNQELSGVARDIICRTVFGREDAAQAAYSGLDIYRDFGELLKDITERSFGAKGMLIPGYK